MNNVIVTGADGFLGYNLVNRLLNEGMEVYAVVYPGHNIYKNIGFEKLHVKCVDLNHAMNSITEFPMGKIDTLYHLAWTGVCPELRNELEVQMMNVSMTLECMKLAAAVGVKRIVLPGSTNEYLYYGRPINKDAIPSPSNAYGAVKIALRYLCGDFARRNNMEFIYTIITGIYAANRKDNNVIFYTIDKLLKREKPLLTKLEQLWDYVFIDDVMEALYLIGEKGKNGAVYAIGHGDNWPLRNYIEIIHKKIDLSVPLGIGEVPYDCEIIPSSCIDLNDIRRDTGFEPKVGFEEGISRVINTLRNDMEK